MAQIDHSIYFQQQAPDIMGGVQRGISMREMIDQRKARQAENERAQKSREAFSKNVGPDGLNKKAALSDLYKFDPEKAYQYEQLFQKQENEDRLNKIQTKKSQLDLGMKIFGSAVDQNSYNKAREDAIKFGIVGPNDMPPQYNPEWVRQKQMAMMPIKDRLNYQLTKEQNASNRRAKQRELDIKAKAVANKLKNSDPYEKERKRSLGKAAGEWFSKDRNTFITNLQKTNTATSILEEAIDSGDALFGPARGNIPDAIRRFTNEKALIVRDAMHSAIQDTLRPTLGAQFTEKEGERILNLAINPGLSDEENYRRAKELQKAIQTKIEATDALHKWIRKKGSDEGFPYEKYNMVKVDGELSGETGGASGTWGDALNEDDSDQNEETTPLLMRDPEQMTDDELDQFLGM